MTNFFKRFAQEESGAVTVDWVVLTAAIVGLGIAISGTIFGGVKDLADAIEEDLPVDTITPQTSSDTDTDTDV